MKSYRMFFVESVIYMSATPSVGSSATAITNYQQNASLIQSTFGNVASVNNKVSSLTNPASPIIYSPQQASQINVSNLNAGILGALLGGGGSVDTVDLSSAYQQLTSSQTAKAKLARKISSASQKFTPEVITTSARGAIPPSDSTGSVIDTYA